jgi:hypothetical protein
MRLRLTATVFCVAALAGCGSARFGGPAPVARAPVYNAPVLEPAPAVPSEPVEVAPLPPPGGYGAPGPGPVIADVPPTPAPEPLRPTAEPPAQVAVAAPSRAGVIGGWTAREAAGSCRVQLASTPALDLYRASSSGCANRELARVTAWDFRDGEVFLYQPGGSVAARLRPAGGSLEGVLARSGAPLTLTR